MDQAPIENPYRPGAGHMPPVLGGREQERRHFRQLLQQSLITENVLVTGLRGFGKTVLVEEYKRIAQAENWLWVGNDLSETSTLTEERLCVRILADIAEVLNTAMLDERATQYFNAALKPDRSLDGRASHRMYFETLKRYFDTIPGHAADKMHATIATVLSVVEHSPFKGLVLAYDEAQCLHDHAQNDEFPLSVLVETVSNLQKKAGAAPCVLVLSGLPAIFDALTNTRTYTERMFHVLELDRLSRADTDCALREPLNSFMPPLYASDDLLNKVVDLAGGYPYLIQFFGRELFEKMVTNGGFIETSAFPDEGVLRRLDAGLFASRWNKTTDKQRHFLGLIASRPIGQSQDFTARELAELSRGSYASAQATQLLTALCDRGLIYRSRRGHYAFTVPMSEVMIRNRLRTQAEVENSWRITLPPAPRQMTAPAPAAPEAATVTDAAPPPLPAASSAPTGVAPEAAQTSPQSPLATSSMTAPPPPPTAQHRSRLWTWFA